MVDLQVPAPVEAVPIAEAPEDELAEKIVRAFVALCESPLTRPLVTKLSNGAVNDVRGVGRFGTTVSRVLYARLGRRVRARVTLLRIELVTIQLTGMAIVRYGLKMEPMASLPREELVILLVPQVSAALRSETDQIVRLDSRATPPLSPALNPQTIYKVTGRPG